MIYWIFVEGIRTRRMECDRLTTLEKSQKISAFAREHKINPRGVSIKEVTPSQDAGWMLAGTIALPRSVAA